jgi:hypothetical protein
MRSELDVLGFAPRISPGFWSGARSQIMPGKLLGKLADAARPDRSLGDHQHVEHDDRRQAQDH